MHQRSILLCRLEAQCSDADAAVMPDDIERILDRNREAMEGTVYFACGFEVVIEELSTNGS